MRNVKNDQWTMGSAIHAVQRAIEVTSILLNDQDNEDRKLLRLQSTLEQFEERSPTIAANDLPAWKEAAQRIYEVLTATQLDRTVTGLNALLRQYARPPRLTGHDQSPWHIHIDSHDDAPWAEWFLTSSAMALAILISEKQRVPSKRCASLTCGKLFVDVGQGGPRQFCSPRCATRERVAAHRRKQRSGS